MNKEVWDIQCVQYIGHLIPQLKKALKEGWEPFAVTCLGNPDCALIWLRKKERR